MDHSRTGAGNTGSNRPIDRSRQDAASGTTRQARSTESAAAARAELLRQFDRRLTAMLASDPRCHGSIQVEAVIHEGVVTTVRAVNTETVKIQAVQ